MNPTTYLLAGKNRRIFLNFVFVVTILLFVALLATLLIRSNTAFSYFTRLELCALCGIEQTYRETCILDQPILRLTSQRQNGVSKVFRTTRKNCGHNFHTVQERMSHLSIPRTPMFIKRQFGNDYGADVLSHPAYIAALAGIHATNSQSSQLVWHRTFRHFANSRTDAMDQIRGVLKSNDTNAAQAFLTTNRYFRPARPNPERWFYSIR